MTKRDFFVLIVKLFGLYSVVTTIFSTLPNNIMFSFEYFDIGIAIWIAVVFIVTVGIFWILTFKADKLVDFLKLDKGFSDNRVELGSIKSEDIIETGAILIGGLVFVRNVPGLLSNIFWAFKGGIIGVEFTAKDKVNLGISGLNVLVGYLLFTNYDVVTRFLKKKKVND
jgi:hypothetical protein